MGIFPIPYLGVITFNLLHSNVECTVNADLVEAMVQGRHQLFGEHEMWRKQQCITMFLVVRQVVLAKQSLGKAKLNLYRC